MSRADWDLGHDFAGERAELIAEAVRSDAKRAIASLPFAAKRAGWADWNCAAICGRTAATFRTWLTDRVTAQMERAA